MNSEATTRLELSDKSKGGKKVVQLDKPKPVTQVTPLNNTEKKEEQKDDIFVRQQPQTNVQDLLSKKL